MRSLVDSGEILGAQCAVYVGGSCVVDAACGRLGPVDARPVRPAPPPP